MNDWSSAEGHAEKAHEYFQAGLWDQALAELRLALAVNPEQSDWHFGMGLTLDQMERYDEAIKSFEQVLSLRGEDVDAMLHLAVDLIRSGRCQRALEVLERITRLDSLCEQAHCYRIAAYTQLGDHDAAEQAFYEAVGITDQNPMCYDHIAQSLALRGKFDRAVWCWQQALKLDPQYPEVYANLARVHWKRGQLERAAEFYLQQLRREPGDVNTLLQLGTLLLEMGRSAEASEKFRRVLELDPAHAEAHLRLGEMALDAGHFDAAAVELEMTQQLEPGFPGLHLRLAQLEQQRNRTDRAKDHLQAELDQPDHQPGHVLDLSRMLIEFRQPKTAIDLLGRLLDNEDPPIADAELRATALLYRGVAWMLMGQYDLGITDCRQSVHLAPRNTLAMHNLVLAYLEQGRLPRARYWLQRAMTLQPGDSDLRRLGLRLRWARWRALGQRLREQARAASHRIMALISFTSHG